jgi:tetratricopeptide (TPR) repeat protein
MERRHLVVSQPSPRQRIRTRVSTIAISTAAIALLSAWSAPAVRAQAQAQPQDTASIWSSHDSPRIGEVSPSLPPIIQPEDLCLQWTEGKTDAATVSAANLKAPPAAHDEYKKACGEVKAKRLDGAEAHVRKAINLSPDYPGAWALLGQVLEANQRFDDAKYACSRATTVDASYAPAYLCLSDLAAQKNDWQASLDYAGRSVSLDPIQNPYGHFYIAVAQMHLGKVSQAESSAHDALDADHQHRVPQVHLLLAQIYGSEGDLKNSADQLRAYLKVARNAPDAAEVKKSLAQLNSQISK